MMKQKDKFNKRAMLVIVFVGIIIMIFLVQYIKLTRIANNAIDKFNKKYPYCTLRDVNSGDFPWYILTGA